MTLINVRYEVYQHRVQTHKQVQHIILEHPLTKDEDARLCDCDLTGWEFVSHGKTRKTKYMGNPIEMCPKCIELFKQSEHPEAVAYRRMFEVGA